MSPLTLVSSASSDTLTLMEPVPPVLALVSETPSTLLRLETSTPSVSPVIADIAEALTEEARQSAEADLLQLQIPGVAVVSSEVIDNSSRRTLLIARAEAEQARRAEHCLRDFTTTLLTCIPQPCLTLNASGEAITWNAAFATQIGQTSPDTSLPLDSLADSASGQALKAAMCCIRKTIERSESASSPLVLSSPLTFRSGYTAAQATLVPLCRIPGVLESVLVLLPCA